MAGDKPDIGSPQMTFGMGGARRFTAVLSVAAVVAVAGTAVVVFAGVASGAGRPAHSKGHRLRRHDRGGNRFGHERYTIGLFGDMPYGALGRSQYPNLLADVNRSRVAFSVFDGDLQAGGDGPCNDSLYTTAQANFNTLQRPLIWVPGDNDWTDCWGRYGAAQAPYHDPIERLNFERQLFDSTSQSLGQHTLTLTRESAEGGQYSIYSENVRWVYGPVVYVGLDVQGSNDNYPYPETDTESGAVVTRSAAEIQRQRDEETARKAADLHWLDESFAYAKHIHAKGILIDWQADPNFNNEQHLSNPHDWDAFPDYVDALRTETMSFSGQVVLVHGDSHYFKMDKPINLPSGGVLANFTRVETFGARQTHWVSATIDPSDPNLFEFEPRIVSANVG
jgi:hypothetical protein